ncbi:DNA repair protein rad32 [Metarhizium guizhouense ARSEF 977]|uniref:Double-strand break repair protein n=1 Tax=Metarhizium guizhouense (strain ARSEF 977) TaxID=1276136 RepID=A0A0B4HYV0_METGA|nr:DNA repair protein rad32 [Metarhizium guizhouense ARSEF 977]
MQVIPELLVEEKNDARLPGVNFSRDLAPFRVSRGASPISEIEIRDKLPRGIEMSGSHLGLTIVHIFTPLTVERMTNPGKADTIRILVATDNHVGYEERDAIRKDDSWRTFDEILNVARTEDVDMVLLAGDLFHENKPSRKSLYQVMRTLRQNCLGMKPCPLEFLSDAATVFEGAFPHVNYEDPDINISIPVFSIHGNHDDPSGDGNYCSLDLLQAAGLLNYFGRVAEADNIEAKPILLQKGITKLALFGLSNVRDERMFRTFRDHKVKWFRPNVQMGDWFNMLAVHQNHHAHTATSYLPENVLPDWLDLVVWGHEHECLIDPTQNPETGFHVMQPGSSVATSLVPGEAVQKHVAILSVTGKDFKVDKIPLKTVRPFVTRELVLAQDKRFKGLDKKKDNRQEVTRRLMEVVDEMIEEANADWEAIQTDEEALEERPLPLIRLKVEYTASDGGLFECENPQRFSNRFVGKVANTNDVVYFYRKKTSQRKATATLPENVLEALADGADAVKVESLVQDFLSAQSLKVLPQGPFGDAVNQFVSKDDKHAMELFVSEHLTGQVKQLLGLESDDEDLDSAMDIYRTRVEQQMASGPGRGMFSTDRKRVLKPKPDTWDSDFDGNWEDEPDAWTYEASTHDLSLSTTQGPGRADRSRAEAHGEEMSDDEPAPRPTRRTGRGTKAATTKAAEKKASAQKAPARGRSRKTVEQSEEEEADVVMESEEEPAPPPKSTTRGKRATATRTAASTTAKKTTTRGAAKSRQTKLDFSQKSGGASQKAFEISDDEISDDDAFEPAPPVSSRTRRR